jgi:hypothetical protein
MKPLNPEVLVRETVKILREDRERKGYNGCLCLLSPGPGKDGKGAPGLGSAIALRILIEAFGKESVLAVTYVLDSANKEDFTFIGQDLDDSDLKGRQWVSGIVKGYHREDWVEAAGDFAKQLGVIHTAHRMTRYALSHCRTMWNQSKIDHHPADLASMIRSLLSRQMADNHGYSVASGYNLITRTLFDGNKLEDSGEIAPVMNFDRSTLIAIGNYFGISENVLKAPPSNGAKAMSDANQPYQEKFGSCRYYTKLFPIIGRNATSWRPDLVEIADQALYNVRHGLPLNEGIGSTEEGILDGIRRIGERYQRNKDKNYAVSLSLDRIEELR